MINSFLASIVIIILIAYELVGIDGTNKNVVSIIKIVFLFVIMILIIVCEQLRIFDNRINRLEFTTRKELSLE